MRLPGACQPLVLGASPVQRGPVGQALRNVLPLLVATRLFLVGTALVALGVFPLVTGDGAWQERAHLDMSPVVAMLSRWDGRWFMQIARDGYGVAYERGWNSAAFPPLLPALMWLGGHAVGHADAAGYLAVGTVVSNLALGAAVVYLYVLVRRQFDNAAAVRSVLCLLVYPFTLFLSAVYSEALFLALAVATFVYADEEQWWLVGLLAALATLTRAYGALLILPLGWEFMARHGYRPGWGLAWLGLVPLAALGWIAYAWQTTGDPLAMAHAQAAWGRFPTPPWQTLATFFAKPTVLTLDSDHSAVNLVFTLGFAALVAMSWRLPRRSLAFAATLLYLPMISSTLLSSVPRFELELFPAFIVLGQVTRRRWLLVLYVVVGSALALYLMARFVLGYWVA